MKRTSVLYAIAASISLLSVSALAQETTLQVGKFGPNPGGLPNAYSVSTATVDAGLQLISSGYGAHYTRDRANGMFAAVEAARTQLKARLLTSMQQISEVKTINTFDVTANPLNVRISQTPAGLRAIVSGIKANASGELKPSAGPFCSTLHAKFTVQPTAWTEYSIATGLLQNSGVYIVVSNVDVSCTGIFSSFTNLLINTFAGGYIRDKVASEVRDATTQYIQLTDGHLIFSAHDFLEGLRVASNYGYLDALANDVINRAQSIVANPSGLNNWYQVDINVSYGTSGNLIRILASHASQSGVVNISYPGMNTLIEVGRGADTGRVELAYRYPAGSGPWYYIGYTDTDSFLMQGSLPVNTEFGAVGISTHSANLRADLGATMITNFDPRCTHNCTPREIEE
jgi:hypothetical protein